MIAGLHRSGLSTLKTRGYARAANSELSFLLSEHRNRPMKYMRGLLLCESLFAEPGVGPRGLKAHTKTFLTRLAGSLQPPGVAVVHRPRTSTLSHNGGLSTWQKILGCCFTPLTRCTPRVRQIHSLCFARLVFPLQLDQEHSDLDPS